MGFGLGFLICRMGITIVSPCVAVAGVGNGVCPSVSDASSFLTVINNSQHLCSSVPSRYVRPSVEVVAK